MHEQSLRSTQYDVDLGIFSFIDFHNRQIHYGYIGNLQFILAKPADEGALSQGLSDKNKPQAVLNLFAEFTGS